MSDSGSIVRPNTVALDDYEREWGASVGFYRHNESERRGKVQTDGSRDSNALDNHRRGACAELALTKFLKVPWNATVNTYNVFPDLDGQMEVRSRRNAPNRVYMRVKQKVDSWKAHYIFVSVSRLDSQNTEFRIDGWILGRDAMQQKYFVERDPQSKQPEWHVPLSDLNSADTLSAEVQRRTAAFNKARRKFQDELRAVSG